MEREIEPNEVHGRGSNKAKHHLIKTDYEDKVAGVSDSAIGESYEVVDVDTSSLNASSPGKSSKKKDQGKRRKSKKSHVESAESLGNEAIVKGQLHESAKLKKGSDEADVDHDSVSAINQGNIERKKKKKLSDLQVNENSGVQLPSGEEGKMIEPVDLAVSCIRSSKRKRKDKGVHKKDQDSGCDTSLSILGGPFVSSSSKNILGETVVDLSFNSQVSKSNNVEPESAKMKKGSDEADVDHDSVNAINPGNLERKKKKKLSYLQVNENSGVQLPSAEVGKMIDPVDLATSSKRKRKDEGVHKKDQGSRCDTSLGNLGGPLVSISTMNILGKTVVDLSSNSRVSKRNNVEPESAKMKKGSDEADVDHGSVNAINQANLERKRKKKFSDLQVNEISGVQLSSGEEGKMIEPVDLAVSCIRSSKRKRKDKGVHKKDQGSGCDTSLSNLGGPLVSSSSMNILEETVVDLSSNSQVSKINNVEPESAKVEKGRVEPDVDHDSVNAINQGNLERKKKKKLSDLQVNANSGVQLPSGEVGKMIEPVDLVASCIKSSKRKKKGKGVHKKNQGSGCDTSVSNLGGPLVSSSSINILGETVVDLSSNSRVSKSNNVELESAEVEKGIDEADVGHDSFNAINQGNLERKNNKKISDLHVNKNSGVQLPSGEVGKMIEPVYFVVSCNRSSKRKRKDNGVHKKEKSQRILERRKEKKKRRELMKKLQPEMKILPPSNFLKKLLILDVNGILVDIVPAGTTTGNFRGRRVLRQKEVYPRPFYMDFLQFCCERFNVAIWSSRTRKNLNHVLNYLIGNSTGKFLFVWNQSHCTNTGFFTIENRKKPLFLKELKYLIGEDAVDLPWEKGVFNESNTLLVDDSPYKALRNPPHTAIFPHPYQFTNTNDVSLGPGGDLRVYLERLACADHVQNFVKENPFGQDPIRENHRSWKYYSMVRGNHY